MLLLFFNDLQLLLDCGDLHRTHVSLDFALVNDGRFLAKCHDECTYDWLDLHLYDISGCRELGSVLYIALFLLLFSLDTEHSDLVVVGIKDAVDNIVGDAGVASIELALKIAGQGNTLLLTSAVLLSLLLTELGEALLFA